MATHDVAMLTDFRYPGGNSSAVEAEIRAQAGAGLSTVLIQTPSPHLPRQQPFSPRIVACLLDGAAKLAVAGDTIRAQVLVIRHPRIFTADIPPLPAIVADEVVMVMNQTPRDLVTGEFYYDLGEVRERIESRFGDRVHWVAISPAARHEVLAVDPAFPFSDIDWHEIINVEDYRTDRSSPVADIPVIGRHSRPSAKKWPATAREILAAYPPTPDVKVRILGGGEVAVKRVGRKPDSWEIMPFGAVAPADFLRTIDFFVYFHDPGWVETFGRTVLEAMASGVPAILPSAFEPLFGDAALYATPDEVADLVKSLYHDWARYLEISARGLSYVKQRFGPETHIDRLHTLGVGPAVRNRQPRPTKPSARPASTARPRPGRPSRPRTRAKTIRKVGRLIRLVVRHPKAGLPRVVSAVRHRLRRPPVIPATAYLAPGMDCDGLVALARVAAQAAAIAGNHRPVIVTDCAEFAAPPDLGVAVERTADGAHPATKTVSVSPGRIPSLSELLAIHRVRTRLDSPASV